VELILVISVLKINIAYRTKKNIVLKLPNIAELWRINGPQPEEQVEFSHETN
jgi:hypothetical protein